MYMCKSLLHYVNSINVHMEILKLYRKFKIFVLNLSLNLRFTKKRGKIMLFLFSIR